MKFLINASLTSMLLVVAASATSSITDREGVILSILDANKDDRVGRDEFLALFADVEEEEQGTHDKRRKLMFDGVDMETWVKRTVVQEMKRRYGDDCEKAFKDFDLDEDGYLDRSEIRKALSRLGVPLEYRVNAANQIFDRIDGEIVENDRRDGKLSVEELTAVACGDPHFATWYGSRFSFHGACDLVLVHNKAFNDSQGLDLHIRTEHMRNKAYSFISNAALRIGEDILEVLATGEHYINGHHGMQLPALIGGFPLTKSVKESCRGPKGRQKCYFSMQFDLNISENDHIYIKVASDMIHVDVKGTDETFYGSVGLMGTYPAEDHGKIARDGFTFIRDANKYAQEWQVLDIEPMLFQGARFPQHPEKCIPAVEPAVRRLRQVEGIDEVRKAAEEACSDVKGPEWEFCIFDVMATGDYGMAATVYGVSD